MSKKIIVVAGLIAVVLVTGVVAVGLSNNAGPDESDTSSSSINEDETENEDIAASVDSNWDGSAVTVQVIDEGGEATQIEARGDVMQTQTIDVSVGKSMELSCSDLSASSGTVDVVGVNGNQVNTLESVEYSGC